MEATAEITPETSRRPGVDGVPVNLADGRTWHLATPTVRLRPRFEPNPDGPEGSVRVELDTRWDYPRAARPKVDALIAAASSDAPTFGMSLVIEAALALLLLCHDLPAADALPLFELSTGEAEDLAVGMLRMFRGDRPSQTEEPENASKEG